MKKRIVYVGTLIELAMFCEHDNVSEEQEENETVEDGFDTFND